MGKGMECIAEVPKVSKEYLKQYEITMKRLYPEKYRGMILDYETENWVMDNPIKQLEPQLQKIKNKRVKKSRFNTEFKKTRPLVLERDNHKCVICGSAEELEVHHIVPKHKGGTNDIDNLQTLCLKCHMKEHENINVHHIMVKKMNNIQAKQCINI